MQQPVVGAVVVDPRLAAPRGDEHTNAYQEVGQLLLAGLDNQATSCLGIAPKGVHTGRLSCPAQADEYEKDGTCLDHLPTGPADLALTDMRSKT